MATMSDGVEVFVERSGGGDRRVVLTHGFAGSSRELWHDTGIVDHLVGAGLEVVTWDLRGHGRSDRPTDPDAYGDDRLARDLVEVVGDAAAGTVVAGYSLGAAITLLALAAGLDVRAAVVGAAPPAVLRWTADDEAQRDAAVAALRAGGRDHAELGAWIAGLEAAGESPAALGALLARHRPVVNGLEAITVPVEVAAGRDDPMAADPAELARRLPNATSTLLPGDHLTAFLDPAFVELIERAAR